MTPTLAAITVANETLVAQDPRVIAATTKKAGLNETVQQFLSHDSVTGDPTSAVLTFSSDASNGPRAREIANDWAAAYKDAADLRDRNTFNAALAPLVRTRKSQERGNSQKLQSQGPCGPGPGAGTAAGEARQTRFRLNRGSCRRFPATGR